MRVLSSLCALSLISSCSSSIPSQKFNIVQIAAISETDPVIARGDRADDPAIWVHPTDASKTLILGTDKEEGLYVYDLAGNQRQFLDVGRLNNVDLRGNVAVGSNDEVEGLSWFTIDPETQNLTHLGDTPVSKFEPYGACMGWDDLGIVAAATYKDGWVQIWRTELTDGVIVGAPLVRTVKLDSKLEGCVFDEDYGRLFIGEEAFGIWSLDYRDEQGSPIAVDRIADGNGLVEDTEGLSIWHGQDGSGYLVASAQAANRFVVYDRQPPHAPRGVFTVSGSNDGLVDAVSHTDGLDVVSDALPGFPLGLLVVQDDANPRSERNQNFKLINWADVAEALALNE